MSKIDYTFNRMHYYKRELEQMKVDGIQKYFKGKRTKAFIRYENIGSKYLYWGNKVNGQTSDFITQKTRLQ